MLSNPFELMNETNYTDVNEEPSGAAEPVMARTMTPFDRVMVFLHGSNMTLDTKRAVSRQLRKEVADENLGYLKSRLSQFAGLGKGWDGEDALPAEPKATENMKDILFSCRPDDVADWALFPNTNGTYLLQKQHALINIGEKQFTYWAEADGKDIGEEYVPFSVNEVLKAIRTINAYA